MLKQDNNFICHAEVKLVKYAILFFSFITKHRLGARTVLGCICSLDLD